MNNWNPEPGVFKDDAQAKASFQALQEMKKRGIPTVISVWEGPGWLLGGSPEQSGRTLAQDKYKECIDSIAEYLKVGRDKYGVEPEYFSFNEPDYGVNFKFTSKQMITFVRMAGTRFKELGLKTKFLVADTANGTNFYYYALPMLEDKSIAPFLGPIAFHCWDALTASETAYSSIAELGRKYKKPVWCLEAGHDAALWQTKDPWGTWENGLRTAQAYARTLTLTEASLMDYWTYQDNYAIVDPKTVQPYPVFHVMRQMQDVLVPGWKVVSASSGSEDMQALVTLSPDGSSFGVLLVNPVGPGNVVLTGLPSRFKAQVIVSDSKAQRKTTKVLTTSANGQLDLAIGARSVVTVLGSR